MTLDDLKSRWETHERNDFPLGQRSKRFEGMSLTAIESEIGGFILSYIESEGRLGTRQNLRLRQLEDLLVKIISELEEEAQPYFEELLGLAKSVSDKLEIPDI